MYWIDSTELIETHRDADKQNPYIVSKYGDFKTTDSTKTHRGKIWTKFLKCVKG